MMVRIRDGYPMLLRSEKQWPAARFIGSVIVKEYSTPFGWVNVLCAVVLYNLWHLTCDSMRLPGRASRN